MPLKTSSRKSRNNAAPRKRVRLSPEIRRAHIIESAAQQIVQQGYLPLPIEQLANSAGASKALLYKYFPDQYSLCNCVLHRELPSLLEGGLNIASQIEDLDQAALLCATLYFEHVARCGPLLHILLSDGYMVGRIDRKLLRMRNTVLRRLSQHARAKLRMSKPEILAALEMLIAIPEEAGRLVFTKELDLEVGRQLCRTLITSALNSLRNPGAVLDGLVRSYDVA
jgi:AcrR family transcriptional regulator